MKATNYTFGEMKSQVNNGIQILNINEMIQIRGGGGEEKTGTKEADVYDTRQE